MINFNPITSAIDLKAYFKVGSAKTAESAKSQSSKDEVVEFSDTSRELNLVKDAIDSLPEIRLEKVDEIKRKIQLNDYPIKNNIDEALKKLMANNIVLA
jgi:anti-sigma28 factor (negative regulator of flagellin synthesis)